MTQRTTTRNALLVAALLVFVVVAALVAGCSTSSGSGSAPAAAPAPQGPGSLAAQQQSNGAIVPGYTISIPKLHETSTLQGLGLNADHTIQVPPLAQPMQAGVYTHGPMPGQKGPAVVLAHVNANGQQGFGSGFHTLAKGDEVDFTTPSGPVKYKVTDTTVVDKAAYPVSRVWSDTPDAQIRLITCGPGAVDSTGHNYVDQTIVYGVKV